MLLLLLLPPPPPPLLLLLRLPFSSPSRASWGGGYSPEDDSIYFKKAVTLNRRFVLLPASWSFQLSHGPMLLLLFFR
jgi:hypothetical protein